MKVTIVTIGDEILIGQITDTNTVFLAKQITKFGAEVIETLSVKDTTENILDTLYRLENKVDLILITGGLGPTNDDVTRHTLCEYYNTSLEQDNEVLMHIKTIFANKGKDSSLNELNRKQSYLPKIAKRLWNRTGTAPAMWFNPKSTTRACVVALPGVPLEMKIIFKEELLPKLKEEFTSLEAYHCRYANIVGIPESQLAQKIAHWEQKVSKSFDLAYLPSFGWVQLRLSIRTNNSYILEQLDDAISELASYLKDDITSYDAVFSLPSYIGNTLQHKKQTLAITESCTGGSISKAFVEQKGASTYYKGGITAYDTEIKKALLGISQEILDQYGVTSDKVANQMSQSLKEKFNVDYTIATTGNLDPISTQGKASKGTFFISITTPQNTYSKEYTLQGNTRLENIEKATKLSIYFFYKIITN